MCRFGCGLGKSAAGRAGLESPRRVRAIHGKLKVDEDVTGGLGSNELAQRGWTGLDALGRVLREEERPMDVRWKPCLRRPTRRAPRGVNETTVGLGTPRGGTLVANSRSILKFQNLKLGSNATI